MPDSARIRFLAVLAPAALLLAAVLGLAACGTESESPATTTAAPPRSPTAPALPGTGKPLVTIGDKNFTEQFVLGELYAQALEAQGYSVVLNRNIGPTEVTTQALSSGRLSMYPEYVGVFNSAVAGYRHTFRNARAAYAGARHYARAHGLELLRPTPFSDTGGIAVLVSYASVHGLRSLLDLHKVASAMTIGGPLQFQQISTGLPALEQSYAVKPAAFKALDVGGQYTALDHGLVQGAAVSTTDGQLLSGNYTLLRDPLRAFGYGQAIPVVRVKVLAAEGPAFAATINRVSGLLTLPAIRELNAAVDVYQQDPVVVAKHFLQAHGLVALKAP